MSESTSLDSELLDECRELLTALQADIPSIDISDASEKKPNRGVLQRMHRNAHTAKGLIGFLGAAEMDGLASRLTETLRQLRDGEAEPTREFVDGIVAHTTKLTELLAAAEIPTGPAGPDNAAPPAFLDTRATMVFSDTDKATAGSDAASWNELQASACRGQVAALSKAVAKVLSNFGVDRVSCGEDSVNEFAATTHELTTFANSEGQLRAAIIFGFDWNAAQVLADRISAFMFGETVAVPAGEEDEFVRGALGEMISFTLLAVLNTLGLPPEIAAPRFVKGKGVKLSPAPRAVRSFSVTTEFGGFEVSFAPGAALCESEELSRGGDRKSTAYRRRVIVADDSAVMRKTIERTLTRAGYEVVAHVSDGRETIEEFRRHRPDLLVLDLSMPVMGGHDALKIIRAEDPTARVLICSAIAESEMIKRGLDVGSVGYITKPFKAEKLVETVNELLGERGSGAGPSFGGGPSPLGVPSLGIYRVGQPLGEGGMATVYEGHDPGLGRKVALKVINEKRASDVDLVVRFLEEARTVARVNHPNVVSIYFAGSDKGYHFFAMELLPGPDLETLVCDRGPLPPGDALLHLRHAALGLAAAERKGLMHCDVKPSNFVFGSDGLVKVTDFGIARRLGTEDNPAISDLMGTPCFMSPEQVLGQPIDHRTDIYSLGATLHFLLTGKPPYDGDDGAEVALRQVHDPVPTLPKASRKLNKLLGRMMAKSPGERHADYDELLKDIDRLL